MRLQIRFQQERGLLLQRRFKRRWRVTFQQRADRADDGTERDRGLIASGVQ